MKRMIIACFCIVLYTLCADAAQPPWTPITDKNNSLTISGHVFDRYGSPIQEEGYAIAAFNHDNVCLGMANISKNGVNWEFRLVLNFDDDDQAVFKLWDGKTDKIYDLPEKIELSKQTRYESKIFGQPVSVSPKVGVIGKDMDITISGGGFFNSDTKVFLEFDAGNRGSVISSIDIQDENNTGYAEDVKVVGRIAYVAAGFGLQIVDISNPLRPVLKGSVRADGFANGIEVVGNTAYVVNKDKGVQIIDVSDPEKPKQTGFIEIADSINKIVLVEHTAYVATGTKGLQIIDVSDSAKPVAVGSYKPESVTLVYDVFVIGNIAYATIGWSTWFSGFYVAWEDSFDLPNAHYDFENIIYTDSSRSSRSEVDSLDTAWNLDGGILDRLYGWDNLVRVDDYTSGFWIIAVPKTPIASAKLEILNISDPKNPSKLGSISLDNKKIIVNNGIVYSISENSYGNNTMKIIDVSDPTNPVIAGSLDIHGYPTNIAKNKDKLYMTTQNGGLQVIDIKDPLKPVMAFYVDNDAYANAKSVSIANDMRYTQNGVITKDIAVIAYNKAQNGKKTGYLEIVDLTYSSGFNRGGFTDTDGSAYAVAIHQNKAYVTYGDWNQGGVDIIDISNPSDSKIISHAALPQKGDSIVISGYFAYVLCGNDLQILDIRNPEKSKLISFLNIPMTVRKIAVSKDSRMIYAAVWKSEKEIKNESGKVADLEQTGGLQMIDVSNPENPVLSDFVNTSSDPKGIVINEDRIYLSYNTYYPDFTYGCWFILYGSTECYTRNPKSGIHIIDVSNPSSPLIVGDIKLNQDDSVDDIAINGNSLYLLNRTAGMSESYFSVIDTSNPAEPKWISNIKSPALYGSGKISLSGSIAFVVGYEGNISQIFDVSDPSNPSLVAITDVIGTPQGLASDKGWIYLTYGNRGLFSFAIPTLSNNLQVSDDSKISLTIPKPEIAGNYTLRILSGENTYVIPGAITIVPENDDLLHAKAIIVAGYLYKTDSILPETKMAADYAYETLLKQGYSEENIYYLSSDKEPYADLNYLEDGIKVWASDASELLIYIVDHGGDKTFYLNPEEQLIKEKLNDWLTVLQDKMKGRLIIIYDACMSGSFIPLTASSDRKPIIITSTKPDEKAHFLPKIASLYPPQSFSYHFWTAVSRYGGRIWDAFTIGKDKMKYLQTPLIDTDGDGIGNEQTDDLETIKDTIIGRGVKMQSRGSESVIFPEIKEISPEQILNGETSSTIWAEAESSEYLWVLILTPENQHQPPDTPTLELPRTVLTYNSNNARYEGSYNNFIQKGIYKIIVYATDSAGNFASPKQTSVIQTKNLVKADINDDGSINLADAILALQVISGIDTKIRSDYAGSKADVNGDNRIGLEEALYILQNIAGLR